MGSELTQALKDSLRESFMKMAMYVMKGKERQAVVT